jgi:hypothetical protein
MAADITAGKRMMAATPNVEFDEGEAAAAYARTAARARWVDDG